MILTKIRTAFINYFIYFSILCLRENNNFFQSLNYEKSKIAPNIIIIDRNEYISFIISKYFVSFMIFFLINDINNNILLSFKFYLVLKNLKLFIGALMLKVLLN